MTPTPTGSSMVDRHPLLKVHTGLLPFLQFTADAVAELLGFQQCVISLRDGDRMVVMATAGDPPDDGLGLRPLELPLWDESHETVGMLTAVMPAGTPTPAQVDLVRRYAAQAGTAIRVSLGLRDDLRQIRVSDNSRAAVRALANADDLDAEWPRVLSQVAEAYEADEVFVHSVRADGGWRIATTHAAAIDVPAALDHLTARGRAAWARGEVQVISPATVAAAGFGGDVEALILSWFERGGVGSVLLVPIGAGEELLGTLVISRRAGAHEWSETELQGATALGADLGLVILTRRTLDQQAKFVAELQAIDAYQDQLVSTVTTMLRAPLGRIQSQLETLPVTPDADEVSGIDQDVQEMNQLVDDLLFFSRVTDPRRSREVETVNLTSVARRAVDLIAPMAERDGLALTVRVHGVDPLVSGDESELTRMLLNVVSNAVRFTPAGSAAVTVARGAAEAEITIRDTGIGIPVEDQSRVFDEFHRGGNALGLPGSGLGLPIASRIAARHGGRVMLASELGVGTTVRINLPLAP